LRGAPFAPAGRGLQRSALRTQTPFAQHHKPMSGQGAKKPAPCPDINQKRLDSEFKSKAKRLGSLIATGVKVSIRWL
jgi:hypothetical protein